MKREKERGGRANLAKKYNFLLTKLYECLSVHQSICPSVHFSICPSFYLLTCLFLSVSMAVPLSFSLTVDCKTVGMSGLSAFVSVWQFVYLPVSKMLFLILRISYILSDNIFILNKYLV